MKRLNSQRGQALILIAFAAIGLFAFAALAIDGSRAYSDKRHAQNTADTSVLAAALAQIRTEGSATAKFSAARAAALARAASNGYGNNGTFNVVVPGTNTVTVEKCSNTSITNMACEGLPAGADRSEYIRVRVVSYLPTTFARIIGRRTITNAAEAIAHVSDDTATSSGGGTGFGITTLGDNCSTGGLFFTGSGPVIINGSIGDNACFDASASGDFTITGNIDISSFFDFSGTGDWTVGGYVWVNGFDKSGNGSFDVAGSFFSNDDFRVRSGDFSAGSLSVVGTATHNAGTTVTPWPAGTGSYEAPGTITDPFASVLFPPPDPGSCVALNFGGSTSYVINPGCYTSITRSGSGNLTLNPGIYFLKGNFTVGGSGDFTANGVMIYMQNGSLNTGGNITLNVSPMTSGTYQGLSVYVDRTNSSPITLSGSGNSTFVGTVYAPASNYTANGSGSSFVIDSQIISRRAEFTGSGGLTLNFNPENNFGGAAPDDPTIELTK
jgi:Flp pilus assembly protein TadG